MRAPTSPIRRVPCASIGADQVAEAAADGHTLLMGHIGTPAVDPSRYRRLPYRPLVDFAPVGGGFTMDATDAAYAMREAVKPKYAIPMHYRVAPRQKPASQVFAQALQGSPTRAVLLQPGLKAEF